jgi:hypothetical protein
MRVGFFLLFPLLLVVVEAQEPKGGCAKSITFAVAANGSLTYRLPNVSTKWLNNAHKKFPSICFSQSNGPSSADAERYLIVLSTQSSAFNGLYPAYRTSIDTTTSPVSGNGTVTDNAGSSWTYTYQGTLTSTTTTTQQTSVPYTDTTLGLFANAYDRNGNSIGSARRAETFRQGGDAANTLGYNLGARLSAIHIKERLLDEIVGKVNAAPSGGTPSPAASLQNSPLVPIAPVVERSSEGNFDTLWTNAAVGMHNIETFARDRNASLPPNDEIASNGVLKCIADANSSACFDNWPLAQKAYAWMLELGAEMRGAKSTSDSLLGAVADDLKPTWSSIRDVYCQQSPGASYTNLDGGIESCR